MEQGRRLMMGSTSHDPACEDIGLNETTNSFGLAEIVEDFRSAHTGIRLFKARNDGLDVSLARWADGEIVLSGGQRQDGMSIPRAYLNEAAIEPETRDVEMISAIQVFERRDDDVAGNVARVLLPGHVVELAVGKKKQASVGMHFRGSVANESDRGIPGI